jgi:hypothetical protein
MLCRLYRQAAVPCELLTVIATEWHAAPSGAVAVLRDQNLVATVYGRQTNIR